jgi:hypothetical protein
VLSRSQAFIALVQRNVYLGGGVIVLARGTKVGHRM